MEKKRSKHKGVSGKIAIFLLVVAVWLLLAIQMGINAANSAG